MGAGYGACEDRGCGKDWCEEECLFTYHIDMLHQLCTSLTLSSNYCTHKRSNLEVGYSQVFLGPMKPVTRMNCRTFQQYQSTCTSISIIIITNVIHYRMHHKA